MSRFLIPCALLLCLALLETITALMYAPEGYEDARGWHQGPQPISRPASAPAPATTDRRNHNATREPGMRIPGDPAAPAINGSRAGAKPEPQYRPGGNSFCS